MPINVLMPALSPTMEKGNLAKWLKKEGDKVKSGDVLAEIETDKATMEVEAVDEGVLAKILVPEGTADVPVNDVIAVIAGEGEDAKAIAMSANASAPAAPASPAQAAALSQTGGCGGCRIYDACAGSVRAKRGCAAALRHAARTPDRQRGRTSTSRGSKAPARMAASSNAM